ncbi:MAG: hypothetical protein PHG08_00700 [Bacilli bacterium]|nr:hypothetical protein [Bacilli bacterium]
MKIIKLWQEFYNLKETYPDQTLKFEEVLKLFSDYYNAVQDSLGRIAIDVIRKEIVECFKVIKGEVDE